MSNDAARFTAGGDVISAGAGVFFDIAGGSFAGVDRVSPNVDEVCPDDFSVTVVAGPLGAIAMSDTVGSVSADVTRAIVCSYKPGGTGSLIRRRFGPIRDGSNE